MNKKIVTTVLGIMALVCTTAFAAVPAFDTPEQEAAHWRQVKAQQEWDELHNNNTACENPTFYAVPAFDAPEEEAAHWVQVKKQQEWDELHNNNTACENPTFYAVPAFDSPEQEAEFWAKNKD